MTRVVVAVGVAGMLVVVRVLAAYHVWRRAWRR